MNKSPYFTFPSLLSKLFFCNNLFQMALLSSLIQIAGAEAGLISPTFKPEFFKLVVGTLSLPIDLPGTQYRSGLQVDFLISPFNTFYMKIFGYI